jgi:Putative lactococcus lactis phage r1t holin
MFTAAFWKAALERAVKTFAQSTLALLTGDGMGLLDVDWATIGSVGGLAAAASLLTSIVSLGFGPKDSPSLVAEPSAVALRARPRMAGPDRRHNL